MIVMSKKKKIEKVETGATMDGANMGGNKPNIKRVRQNSPNAPEYPPTHGGLLGTQQIDWKKDKGKTPTGKGGSGSKNAVGNFGAAIEKEDGGGDGGFGDGGGTVFTSTNAGIFTPTYGGNRKKRRVKSKKKRTGIERLGVFLTDGSPEKKMSKGAASELQQWLTKEEPPKVVEHDISPDSKAAIKQKDMENKISSLDDSANNKSGEKAEFPTDYIAPHIQDVKLNKQPQAFGNPQDDELKRGSKLDRSIGSKRKGKDDSEWEQSLEFELTKFIEELRKASSLSEYGLLDDINVIKSDSISSALSLLRKI